MDSITLDNMRNQRICARAFVNRKRQVIVNAICLNQHLNSRNLSPAVRKLASSRLLAIIFHYLPACPATAIVLYDPTVQSAAGPPSIRRSYKLDYVLL